MKEYILMATDEFISDRFKLEFKPYKNVSIWNGLFEDLESIDCLVSPANSFGLMDGGMDKAIINYFGNELQNKVQKHISTHYFSEQPVGTSFVVETNNKNIPYLAHTPTMRIPSDISATDNIYNAMRATLMAVEKYDDIKVVAIPAFGHGAGKVHATKVAYQMAKAYLQFIAQPNVIDWNYAMNIEYAAKGEF